MTFCSQCGVECVANAKFCHSCGCEISQQRPRNATATSSANSTPSTSGSTLTHINSNRSRLSFGAYRTRKEVERSSCFKPKGPNPKKMKTQSAAKVTVDVKVNVGIVTFRDEKMLPRRNTTLPLTVKDTVGKKELLNTAVEKHSRFNSNLISNNPEIYRLLFGSHGWLHEVRTMPGSEEPFVLRRYKEEIGKPYSKISFYICSLADFLEYTMNTSSSEEELPVSVSSVTNRDYESVKQADKPHSDKPVVVPATVPPATAPPATAPPATVPSATVPPTTALPATQPQTVQCPLCIEHFPVEEIEVHADECCMWLLNEDIQEATSPVNVSEQFREEQTAYNISSMTKNEVKNALINEISKPAESKLVNVNPKRITVRRKLIWEDFKNELVRKVTPATKIKVVFAGEPAVDDGGPRRELFSGKF